MTGPRPRAVRILLAEDHASTRIGIRQILEEDLERVEFGEAGDARSTLELVAERSWDLLVLDISLPDRNGLEALREARAARPELRVLVYSAHPEDQFAIHALREGAAGYLTKERAPEELTTAVRRILAGGRYLGPALASRLKLGLDLPGSRPEALSERELQVLRLIAAGRSGKAIASELGLSPKTVSTYRARLLHKLGIESTAALVQFAARRGLL